MRQLFRVQLSWAALLSRWKVQFSKCHKSMWERSFTCNPLPCISEPHRTTFRSFISYIETSFSYHISISQIIFFDVTWNPFCCKKADFVRSLPRALIWQTLKLFFSFRVKITFSTLLKPQQFKCTYRLMNLHLQHLLKSILRMCQNKIRSTDVQSWNPHNPKNVLPTS